MNNIIEDIKKIAKADSRYRLDAYLFVFEALDHTIKRIVKEKRHVTGKELLQGIKLYAIKQFGPLAKTVFNTWGVYKTDDFGEIVFNMVSKSLMGKTDTDTKEDFANVYNFDEVFSFDAIENKKKKK